MPWWLRAQSRVLATTFATSLAATILAATMQTIQAHTFSNTEHLARPASSYGVDATTYHAIIVGEMAGLGLAIEPRRAGLLLAP